MALLALLLTLFSPSHAGPVATLETESFLGDERSWRIIEEGYPMLLKGRLTEVEGAMPGRFFPKTNVFALDHVSKGHFLKVVCLEKKPRPCPEKRTVLEARIVAATFLEAAPRTVQLHDLFDPESFALTPLGESTLAKAEAAYPDLWPRLKRMTERAIGTKKGTLSMESD
jgi:hypothetical protein